MGDRNNPIKFGPEWLRNLSQEPSNTRGSVNTNQNPTKPGTSSNTASTGSAQGSTVSTRAMSPPRHPGAVGGATNLGGTAAQGAVGGSASNASTSGSISRNTSKNPPRVLLAKSRYGKEEMLALYDRTTEAPNELKHFDLLYQSRGKQPVALNNTFEEVMRDNARAGPSTAGMSTSDRFGMGRNISRSSSNDTHGRSRMPFVRQTSTARGNSWHMGSTRLPGYKNAPVDDAGPLRSWGANNGNNPPARTNNEQQEWVPNKVYRRRQANNTNWRQQARDEGDEWRSSEGARHRPNVDKWDRDWGERPVQDRPRSWNSNRRTCVGGEGHNDDNLPEWAIDKAEAGAGTFDSSGAFHGYSNDDTNLPKPQDSSFPLVRSHTHGSFVRSKTTEESSEEWWASEKAKKLSPKRFDATEIKFKKATNTALNEENPNIPTTEEKETEDTKTKNEVENNAAEKPEETATTDAESPEDTNTSEDQQNTFNKVYTESNTFDALMRSDIDMEEVSDDRGNFQSVMIAPTNSLRQKHQNIVASANENTLRHGRIPVLQMLHTLPTNENDTSQTPDKLVEEIVDSTLEDAKITTSNITSINANPSSNPSDHRLSSTQLSSGSMRMSVPSPIMPNHVLTMTSTMATSVLQGTSLPTSGMQTVGMQGGLLQAGGLQPREIQTGVMQSGNIQQVGMQPGGIQQVMPQGLRQQGVLQQSTIHQGGMQPSGIQPTGLQAGLLQSGVLQAGGMQVGGLQPGRLQTSGLQALQATGMPTQGLQNVGISNSALNSSLGLNLGTGNNRMVLPIQGVQPSVLSNSALSNPGLGATGLQSRGSANIPGYQPTSGLSVIGGPNVPNSSLFLGQNNNPMQSTSDLQMPNHGAQANLFPMHGLQHSGSQVSFGSIYSNMIPPPPSQSAQTTPNLADQWYYEDPKKIIRGPFSSKEMYNWYRAGFFSPSLMVRRACDAHMRPLGSYGPIVPFAQMDMLSSFPMSSGFESRSQGPHDLLNPQQGLGLDDSLWSQPTSTADLMWMQQAMNARKESRLNNLPMYFWDPQSSAITSNSLLPEEIAKEMKTEDQILAQLRASQNINTSTGIPFIGDQTSVSTSIGNKPDETLLPNVSATPDLEELQKLIKTEALASPTLPAAVPEPEMENVEVEQVKPEKPPKVEQTPVTEPKEGKSQQHIPNKATAETKQAKAAKAENEKTSKNKDNSTKSKNKKSKEEKKEEATETKNKEDSSKMEQKRSVETSPSKSKKEDKQNKKEMEKERKEWVKEGFTIVKGSEKNITKETKKKVDDTKASDDAERKRKEEDKNVGDEKEKKHTENQKKQQQDLQLQRQMDSMMKKAPWSTSLAQQAQATSKDNITLAEIQRLEREKKLEQIKVQQQMMQIIAHQQAVAMAREQEVQAGLGWAKKGTNSNTELNLADIQAEARRLAAATSAVTGGVALKEAQTAVQPPPNVPWVTANNASGFWDPQPNKSGEKSQEKTAEVNKNNKINKNKVALTIVPKKEATPETEFEAWCTSFLNTWSTKIDVPTFIGFLKDIESPYEVKDYVKLYLGESKDSYDFARQFLERRSKLLRVGMVTPSDDLCSPALAINPRNPFGSDYQEVKGKGKKSKKNKMQKVDARILGFSVTASEDRINVGDIDTA